MATILPENERFKKALEAVFENPRLLAERGPEFDKFLENIYIRFDLSPKESEKILHILNTKVPNDAVRDK